MGRLFKRAVALTLAKPLQGQFFAYSAALTVITGLRVAFDIEKNLGKEPNTCTVRVYNLSERTRGELQDKPLHVRLSAGYEDQVEQLFEGDLFWSASKKESADWETTLQLADGERSFKHARVSRSYRSGVDARTAITEVAKSMGLKARFSAAAELALRRQFAGGVVLEGACRTEMSRLLAPYGIDWSIQDGDLLLLKPTEHRSELPVVISQGTGMIGSPEFGAPEKKGDKPLLTVSTLLNARVVPGGRVEVGSRNVNGIFRVERVTHSGDNFGEDWTTTAEAKSIA